MTALEATNCEIREVVDIQFPFENATKNTFDDKKIDEDFQNDYDQQHGTGGFLEATGKYVWFASGTHLTVTNARSGDFISTWTFPEKISSVAPFPSKFGGIPLILIGLDNNAARIHESIGYLYIFDASVSVVLRIIELPAGVEKACIIHGGAEWEDYNEKRPNTLLPNNSGLAFVALKNLQHLVIDLFRDSWNSVSEKKLPIAEIDIQNNANKVSYFDQNNKPIHVALNLLNKDIEEYIGFNRQEYENSLLYEDENLVSVITFSIKTGCLISGCLGRVILWECDGALGWISPVFDESTYITHIALLEPTDDPRPFYYLWLVSQNDSHDCAPVLRMFSLLFKKKYLSKDCSIYFDLDNEPSVKFELELEDGEYVNSLLPIERGTVQDVLECGIKREEGSIILISTDEKLLLFDLNRWYKEQMPRTITEARNPNSIMSSYKTKTSDCKKTIFASLYEPSSFRDFPHKVPTSPEEVFFPNSLSFDWIELNSNSATYWMTRGVQADLLREIVTGGSAGLMKPTEIYYKCLNAGLIPLDGTTEYTFDCDKSMQREMLLSLCLEQRWSHFLVQCVMEWSDGSSAYLYPAFLKWTIQRAAEIKAVVDRLCIPLFDQSGTDIGGAEVKILRSCAQQIECLSVVVSKFPNAERNIEEQYQALRRIATYLQVLLWFHDVGLLPENQEVIESSSSVSLGINIPFPRDKLIKEYEKKRGMEPNKEVLFIDKLIRLEYPNIKSQWNQEVGANSPNRGGYYPPPSLQSLLRIFLTDRFNRDQSDTEEMNIKHSITIYLLMDIAMVLQGLYPEIDRLIKYPSAFKLSPSLIKLTQAFWLLDHEDYEGFFDTITGQLISSSDIKEWHHKLIVDTLLKNNQHKLVFIYFKLLKPPLSSIQDQSTVIELAVEHGLVQSAFHSRPPTHYSQLLNRFFQACKAHGKLKDIMHLALGPQEEELFLQFLKDNGCEETRLLYYLQRSRHLEANDVFTSNSLVSQHNKTNSKIHPISLKMFEVYRATLPNITKQMAEIVKQKALLSADINSKYPQPMSLHRSKHKEIFELAVKKSREISSRSRKNHLPFLGPPCFSMFKSCDSNNQSTNVIMFPQRKTNGKRSLDQIQDRNNISESSAKKRKLINSNQNEETGNLSKIVCETSLVMKKSRKSNPGKDIALETPHSILKIKQMITRNSTSPSYILGNDESILRRSPDYIRSHRVIRFSIDRSSNSSACSTDPGVKNDINIDESTDLEQERRNTHDFNKSLRERTILDDNSITENILKTQKPFQKSALRRSSIFSRTTESDDSILYNTSIEDQSINLMSHRKSKSNLSLKNLSASQKSLISESLYCSTILSSDTDISNISGNFLKENINNQEPTLDFSQSIKEDSLSGDKCEDDENRDSGLPKESMDIQFPTNLEIFELKSEEIVCKGYPVESTYKKPIEDKKENFQIENKVFSDDKFIHSLKTRNEQISEDEGTVEDLQNISNSMDSDLASSSNKTSVSREVEQISSNSILITHLKNIVSKNIESSNVIYNQIDITDDESSQDIPESSSSLSRYQTNEDCNQTINASDIDSDEKTDFIGINQFGNNLSDRAKKHLTPESLDSNDLLRISDEVCSGNANTTMSSSIRLSYDCGRKTRSRSKSLSKETLESNLPSVTLGSDDITSTNCNRRNKTPKKSPKKPTQKEVVTAEAQLNINKVSKLTRSSKLKTELDKTLTDDIPSDDENIPTVPIITITDTSDCERGDISTDPLSNTSMKTSVTASEDEGKIDTDLNNIDDKKQRKPKKNLRPRTRRAVSEAPETSNITEKKVTETRKKRATSLVKEIQNSQQTSIDKEIESKSSSDRKIRLGSPKSPILQNKNDSEVASLSETEETKKKGKNISKKSNETKIQKDSKKIIKNTKSGKADTEVIVRRSTRATSVTSDISYTGKKQETLNQNLPRKRGSSLPKETSPNLSKLLRSGRSTSLLKEVILEEDIDQSQTPSKRSRMSNIFEYVSSPASNTRSRRSSIHSVPEELEEILSPVKDRIKTTELTGKTPNRQRRAVSVDNNTVLTSKRLTRSASAKNKDVEGTIKEIIPEETTKVPSPPKKPNTRRKKESAENSKNVPEVDKQSNKAERPKRGKKN